MVCTHKPYDKPGKKMLTGPVYHPQLVASTWRHLYQGILLLQIALAIKGWSSWQRSYRRESSKSTSCSSWNCPPVVATGMKTTLTGQSLPSLVFTHSSARHSNPHSHVLLRITDIISYRQHGCGRYFLWSKPFKSWSWMNSKRRTSKVGPGVYDIHSPRVPNEIDHHRSDHLLSTSKRSTLTGYNTLIRSKLAWFVW